MSCAFAKTTLGRFTSAWKIILCRKVNGSVHGPADHARLSRLFFFSSAAERLLPLAPSDNNDHHHHRNINSTSISLGHMRTHYRFGIMMSAVRKWSSILALLPPINSCPSLRGDRSPRPAPTVAVVVDDISKKEIFHLLHEL
jgi:hypothetical protein